MRRFLGWLLGWANADPPTLYREDFYALKRRLLERYGTMTGTVEQHLVKPCWGERSWDDEYGEYAYEGCGPDCQRCGGTGRYEESWVTLQEWELGDHRFHVPIGGKRRLPLVANGHWIEGLIRHHRNPRRCREALLWLCLFCDRKLLRCLLGSGYHCTCGAWPLLNLQRAVGVMLEWWRRIKGVVTRIGWDECWNCEAEFWRWPWTRGNVCRACRQAGEEGLPF